MSDVLVAYSAPVSESGLTIDVMVSGARLDLRITLDGLDVAAGVREAALAHALSTDAASRSRVLRASIPAGDVELIDALRQRCTAIRTRTVGQSCLVEGVFANGWSA